MHDMLKFSSSSFFNADKNQKVSIDRSNNEIIPTLKEQCTNSVVIKIGTKEKKRAAHFSQKPEDVHCPSSMIETHVICRI